MPQDYLPTLLNIHTLAVNRYLARITSYINFIFLKLIPHPTFTSQRSVIFYLLWFWPCKMYVEFFLLTWLAFFASQLCICLCLVTFLDIVISIYQIFQRKSWLLYPKHRFSSFMRPLALKITKTTEVWFLQ